MANDYFWEDMIDSCTKFINKPIIKISEAEDFMKQLLSELIEELGDDASGKVCDYRDNLEKAKTYFEGNIEFFTAPASTKYHGAEETGLFRHSVAVLISAWKLAPAFDMIPAVIDACACLMHDLCKVGAYKIEYDKRNGKTYYIYNPDYYTIQHGAESLRWIWKAGVDLEDQWVQAVAYHMGAFIQSDAQNYGQNCEKFKEVLLLHTADMYASKVMKH